MIPIRSEKEITPAQRVAMGEDPGRRPGRLPGGHIHDLVDLKQAIQLCPSCRQKFNRKKAGYVNKRNLPFAAGRCDGCNEFHHRMELMVDRQFAANL